MKFSLASFHQMSDRFLADYNLNGYAELAEEIAKEYPIVNVSYTAGECLDIRAEYKTRAGVQVIFVLDLTKVKSRIQVRKRVFRNSHLNIDENHFIDRAQDDRRRLELFNLFSQFIKFLEGAKVNG